MAEEWVKIVSEDGRIMFGPKYEFEAREKALKEAVQKANAYLFGFATPPESKEDHNVKYALVIIEGNHRLIGVDNQTMVGYKMHEDKPMWLLPLQEQQYDTFIRWATSMDL